MIHAKLVMCSQTMGLKFLTMWGSVISESCCAPFHLVVWFLTPPIPHAPPTPSGAAEKPPHRQHLGPDGYDVVLEVRLMRLPCRTSAGSNPSRLLSLRFFSRAT